MKGFARAGLRIDLDGDKRPDASVSADLSDLNPIDFVRKDTSKSILVFDDIERCAMPLNNILGYINSFVEHQELKVILIANAEELSAVEEAVGEEKKAVYGKIKEKLIGATFQVSHDIDQAFSFFISKIICDDVQQFLNQNKDRIIDIFNTADYQNLRHLKQSLWDFERFFQSIPEKFTSKNELMLDLFSCFLAFSFEIKKGAICPKDILELDSGMMREIWEARENGQKDSILLPIDNVRKKYPFLKPLDVVLSNQLWCKLFNDGYISEEELNESLDKSKYSQTEHTPSWVKLWHFLDLDDEEFAGLYAEVSNQWTKKEIIKPGEIMHVCGLFLHLFDIGLINRRKEDIVTDAKAYIDSLKREGELKRDSGDGFDKRYLMDEGSGGLGYYSNETDEFKQILDYLVETIEETRIDHLPEVGKKLLGILANDTDKFCRMIFLSNSGDNDYYKTPVFQYIDSNEFMQVFLNISSQDKRRVVVAMKERFKFPEHIKLLSGELNFMKNLDDLICQKAEEREGQLSGYIFKLVSESYLQAIIKTIGSTIPKDD